MKLLGLLPDCVGLHQVRARSWDSGGPGARIGDRIAGGVCDGDHQHRSAAECAAVRAVPESGARNDAGYRRGLLHEPARRGDRLRDAQVRARAGGADHHVQYDGGEGGDQGLRARARHAVRRRGPHRQAGSGDGGHDAGQGAGGSRRICARRTTATSRFAS